MALDLRTELASNDANGFVEAVFASPEASTQMANVHLAIEQARTSDDPELQQFAAQLNGAMSQYAQAEKFDVDAEAAAQNSGFGGILQQIMGEDGQFQMSDLQNLDIGQILSSLFQNLFNNEASGAQQQADGARQTANAAVTNALALLDRGEGGDYDRVRRLLGNDNASLQGAVGEIDAISPGAPPPAPSAGPGLG